MIYISLERSNAILEQYPDETPCQLVRGPYEWCQMTYEYLRIAPEGEHVGMVRDGYWYYQDDPIPYSDVCIGTTEPHEFVP